MTRPPKLLLVGVVALVGLNVTVVRAQHERLDTARIEQLTGAKGQMNEKRACSR